MYYENDGLKPKGPLSEDELRDKIKRGHIGPRDLIFNEDLAEWKPAGEWPQLNAIGFPAFEAVGTHGERESVWVVLHLDPETRGYQQQGPYADLEVVEKVLKGLISGHDLVWKAGLSGWSKVKDRQEFTRLERPSAASELDL